MNGSDEFESRIGRRGELRHGVIRLDGSGRDNAEWLLHWLFRYITESKDIELARNELLHRLVTAEENERRRLSRELHDHMGQELTSLTLDLKELETFVPNGSPGRERLREMRRLVDRIVVASHDIAFELRPTALDDLGLRPALEGLVRRWSERSKVSTDFYFNLGNQPRVSLEVKSAIYRIVQEALTNIARQAAARQVSVIVEGRDDFIVMIEDDACGMTSDNKSETTQLGLFGMHERAILVGGHRQIESSPGVGTTIQVRIPLSR